MSVEENQETKYLIREMTSEDILAVLNMWRDMEDIWLDEDCDSADGLARYLLRNPSLSFVAHDNDILIGAVLCGHDCRRGYLHHLAVIKSYRRMGVGVALTESCLAALAKQGIPKCNIFLFSENVKGKQFWERTGWKMRKDLAVLQKKT